MAKRGYTFGMTDESAFLIGSFRSEMPSRLISWPPWNSVPVTNARSRSFTSALRSSSRSLRFSESASCVSEELSSVKRLSPVTLTSAS